jgi:flagellar assembly factor FliW
MPKVHSRYFGPLEYSAAELFTFPEGLPGFAEETAFLPVEVPGQFPLVYLQSLLNPDLCFAAIPAPCLDSGYRINASPDELALTGLSPDSVPGPDALVLALICFADDGNAVANLRAPIVISIQSRRGVQIIQTDDRYPACFSLVPETEEAATCS